jgi:hypothetical protein
MIVVLEKGFLINLNGLIIILDLHKSIGLTSHELSSFDIVVILSLALLETKLTFFNALLEILHFEPTSSFI